MPRFARPYRNSPETAPGGGPTRRPRTGPDRAAQFVAPAETATTVAATRVPEILSVAAPVARAPGAATRASQPSASGPTDPVFADPVFADPVFAYPIFADPAFADTVSADTVSADTVSANPVSPDSRSTAPAPVDPAECDEPPSRPLLLLSLPLRTMIAVVVPVLGVQTAGIMVLWRKSDLSSEAIVLFAMIGLAGALLGGTFAYLAGRRVARRIARTVAVLQRVQQGD